MITTKKQTLNEKADYLIGTSTPACLVTGWSRLAERLRKYFGRDQITVKDRLADLIHEKDCRFFIVDTKVNDINIWPAPLLLEPSTRHKPWLFLLADPSDASFLSTLPTDSAFFERRTAALDALTSYVRKRFDPEARKRIEKVKYLKEAQTFLVKTENERTYALKLRDLPEADASKVIRDVIGRDRGHFRVTQESGNYFEVPWDTVLYHCEPEYEYYKGKEKSLGNNHGRAVRIGSRVRELRVKKGFSITELAERAGMKRPNLSRLESGRHIPSLETLERIADALEVPVAELIARTRPE